MIPLPTDAQPFESLAAMKARHKDLLRTAPPEEDPGSVRARVVEFLARGKATGRILDCPTDRRVAQGLIDYWKATFYTQLRDEDTEGTLDSPALTILEDFAETDSEALAAAAEKTVAAMSDEDREIARRILLKLVQLEPAVRDVHPISVPRSALDEAGNVGNVAHVVQELTKAGVIRTLPNPPTVELTAAHLVRSWKRYADWLKDRLAFRTAAYLWQEQDRHASGLIFGRPLDDAASYRDLDAVEATFLTSSRRREAHIQRVRTRSVYLFFSLVIVGLLIAVALFWRANSAVKARIVADKAKNEAEAAKNKAESEKIKAEAEKNKAEADASAAKAKYEQLKTNQAIINKRVTDINRMMRALSEIVVADTPAEMEITRWRWDQMEKEVRGSGDTEIGTVLDRQKLALSQVLSKDVGFGLKAREIKGRASLQIALALRNQSLDQKDEWVYRMMESVRRVTYHTAIMVVEKLTTDDNKSKNFDGIREYAMEFWRLRWGPLGMVADPDVQLKMRNFGSFLEEWERTKKAPDSQKLNAARRALVDALNEKKEVKIEQFSPDAIPKD
jgi:cell division protein FtsB